MKRILSYLSIVLLSASVACSDSSEMDKAYNSVITPGFTFGGEEIIAGITPVTFTNTTTAEGTTVSEYFWHFGFAGEGNWSEEAAPDPIVYNRPATTRSPSRHGAPTATAPRRPEQSPSLRTTYCRRPTSATRPR